MLRWTLGEARFDYHVLAGVMLALLYIHLGLVVWIGQRLSTLVLFTFLCGPGAVFWVHETGYLDQVAYLLMAATILAFRRWPRSSTVVLSILVHEVALLTSIPLLLFAGLLGVLRDGGSSDPLPVRRLLLLIGGGVLAVGLTLVVLRMGVPDPAHLETFTASVNSSGFPVRMNAIDLNLGMPLGGHFDLVAKQWGSGELGTLALKCVPRFPRVRVRASS